MSAVAVDHRRIHDDENADFSAYLHTVAHEDWEKPSLCEGWRVRDPDGLHDLLRLYAEAPSREQVKALLSGMAALARSHKVS